MPDWVDDSRLFFLLGRGALTCFVVSVFAQLLSLESLSQDN